MFLPEWLQLPKVQLLWVVRFNCLTLVSTKSSLHSCPANWTSYVSEQREFHLFLLSSHSHILPGERYEKTSAPVRGLCLCADPTGQRTEQMPSGEALARRGHRVGAVDRLNRLLLRGRELRV